MKHREALIRNIADSIAFIEEWTGDGFDAFANDVRTTKAVARVLHELTESMQRLEKFARSRYPDVPWAR